MKNKILALLLCGSLHAELIEVHTWKEVAAQCEQFTPDDLVVFDVDNTLITRTDTLFRPQGILYVRKYMKENQVSKDEEHEIASIIDLRHDLVLLMDTGIPATIAKLRNRNIKCIALTAQNTGKVGQIPKMEEWRHEQLKHVGIDFSKGPFQTNYTFPELGWGKRMPVFHDGILCSGKATKGKVLKAFLEKIEFKPKRILFVDDRRDWVEELEQTLNDNSIPNLCIHFRLIESFDLSFDEEIAKKKLDHVRKERVWLSDLSLLN